jgi:acyl-coenzyme A thioesterase PaaI-like protein
MFAPMEEQYFQDYMPDNICFGCGTANPEGLHIRSCWAGEEAVCVWQPQPRYQGWQGILNGGIIATLIDCHCMGTAMAHACRAEGRPLGSEPHYRYATGTLNVKYLLPAPGDAPITLRARVVEMKGRKTRLSCELIAAGQRCAEAEVVAIRVSDSAQPQAGNPFEQGRISPA